MPSSLQCTSFGVEARQVDSNPMVKSDHIPQSANNRRKSHRQLFHPLGAHQCDLLLIGHVRLAATILASAVAYFKETLHSHVY